MNDVLIRACALLGVSESQVMSHHVYDNEIVLVVDYGVSGGKKHSIALEALPGDYQEDADEDDRIVDAYEKYTVIELQNLARGRGITYAGLRKAELIAALEA